MVVLNCSIPYCDGDPGLAMNTTVNGPTSLSAGGVCSSNGQRPGTFRA